MRRLRLFSICLPLLAVACSEPPLMAVGQLESDRVELVAESSEPITAIEVIEGESVQADTVILRQDSSRLEIRLGEADANIERLQALLAEQQAGPRAETIAAARATLEELEYERNYQQRELNRLRELLARDLTSAESVDRAEKTLQVASARVAGQEAAVSELLAGTRQEQIAQTEAQLRQARQQLALLQVDRARLQIASPVTAIVDSLLFEVGERPRIGDVVAVLLSGPQPYARVYIPEPLRASLAVDDSVTVHIDGIAEPLTGRVRRIANEASFTPYFALTERDRSRLSYVAEISLPERPQRLPEGVPVQLTLN